MLRRAFTLIELLVSLSVLLVVIIATARIFGTTSKVAAIGEASADLQATANAVEKVIRGDIERIARDGVLAIQCVAVRNDVNRYQRILNNPDAIPTPTDAINATAPLLDPTRASTDFVRCDQIVFFARGHEASQVYLGTRGGGTPAKSEQAYALNSYPSGTIAITPEFTSNEFMIRLGHGLQFPSLLVDLNNPDVRPDADTLGSNPLTLIPPVPWMWSATPTMTASNFNTTTPNNFKYMPSQPEARQWVLSRQLILLADDGNTQVAATPDAKNVTWFHSLKASSMLPNSATGIAQLGFLSSGTAASVESALSIPHSNMCPNRAITASRVDTAATSISEYRAFVETGSTSANLAKDFNFYDNGRLFWSIDEGPDPTTGSALGALNLGFIRNRIFNSLFGGNVNNSVRTNGMWGYPRAEKVAPSMDRTDSMVCIPLLAGNCSSIQIDWTWSTGTARFETPEGTPLLAELPATTPTAPALPVRPQSVFNIPLSGLTQVTWPKQLLFMPTYAIDTPVTAAAGTPIPWFGLPDSLFPVSQRRGITMLAGPLLNSKARPLQKANPGIPDPKNPLSTNYATPIEVLKPNLSIDTNRSSTTPFTLDDVNIVAIAAPPIDCARIEGTTGINNSLDTATIKYSVYTYQAIFGPNGDKPFREVRVPGGTDRVLRTKRVLRSDYTPWPTALRFTITLHDPKLALAQGRVFQFVVDLPKADR